MTETKTTAKTTKAKAPAKTKTPAKPQAVADEIDFDTAIDGDELKAAPRRSKWIQLLDKLYAATTEDRVPRVETEDGEPGELKFVRLGAFTNINGARTQARALEEKGLGATYEFKPVTKGNDGSELWGRVIEVAETE